VTRKQKQEVLGDAFLASVKKWFPPDCPLVLYPEDVRREFLMVLFVGRWWDWLPCWVSPLREFSAEVAVVARAQGASPVDLARRLIAMAGGGPGELSMWEVSEPHGPPVRTWEVMQSIDSWVFYDLRPALRAVVMMELDGIVG
jgi:hypothetical protein